MFCVCHLLSATGSSKDDELPKAKRAKRQPSKRKQDKPMPQLSEEHWDFLFLLQECLKPFHLAQKQLEGEKYVTASMVLLWIDQLRKHLQTEKDRDDADLAESAGRLLEDLDERWQTWPRATLLAAAMDWRTKWMGFFDKADRDAAWQHIADEAKIIYLRTNKAAQDPKASQLQSESQADAPEPAFAGDYNVNPDADDLETYDADTDEGGQVLQTRIAAEIKAYKGESQIVATADPLKQWKLKSRDYPLLSLVARKWLAVPASSAASERMFSGAGLTVSKKRTLLGSERVSTLVFLKTAWPYLQAHDILY